MWLKCANSNQAETAHNHFIHSMTDFQCPFQVHEEKGSENHLITKHMILLKGTEMCGFNCGRSTHNTRIENLWRECNDNVIDHFLAIFSNLEQIGILNCHDNVDIWALHKVFCLKSRKN